MDRLEKTAVRAAVFPYYSDDALKFLQVIDVAEGLKMFFQQIQDIPEDGRDGNWRLRPDNGEDH